MSGRRSTGGTLRDRLAHLDEALAIAGERLPARAVDPVADTVTRARERLAHGDAVIVAALAGGTGTGKSSLFNALAGEDLAAVGVRRPVTTEPRALVTGDLDETAGLLRWLGIGAVHPASARSALPEGLVLVDLPDHDSVDVAHRERADALVERVDVLIWVVDPMKYAQRALHTGYLRRLTDHAEVVVVVLNRADELSRDDRAAVLRHLRDLLADDGLDSVRVLATSARTGAGVAELAALLGEEARRRSAVAARLAADARGAARALLPQTAPVRRRTVDVAGLVAALAGAVGVLRIVASAGAEYRAAALQRSRPLVSRAIGALVLRLAAAVKAVRWLLPVRTRPPRDLATSVAAAVPVGSALQRMVEATAADLPAAWRTSVRGAVGAMEGLAEAVAGAVRQVRLERVRRHWWGLFAVVVSFVEVLLLCGVLWLAGLWVLDWLRLPAPAPPTIGPRLPWPTAMLLGGGLLRLVAELVRRRAIVSGAQRRQAVVRRRLDDAVAEVAHERVVAPVEAELAAHDDLRRALESAAG